ncbi:PPOX class F420-dependent oxidoreductase [Herbiconiux sp. KACC 21604]|uniref:PPOX class F420-dependent oxidoreductase n=1 Tax=unclassified Herbiconiux TaxID=2618217 RepID=UPI0014925A9E|nr:PPOX class F420-dependent oxidoreductase [Herbiconiux sp. SALV-R1]QJU55204.1 PPOX class F420-dependent oxidoreductase [Herbiconiux sp. SALV-R1]WPO86368.1 PPOX class F420-dependent oxidoreductase [Herbiconiux sp. KACC 21604]
MTEQGGLLTADGLAFVTERHLATLSTLRRDGSPHVVAVGFTFDAETGTVRIITNGPSQKVLNVRRDGRAAVSQVDGGRWLTLEGHATVLDDPASVQDAVDRYALRYRQPQPNPQRVVIALTVTRALGSAPLLAR